ncbi:hypothetical protein HMPREF9120_01963 [Neisseria sp. oral taxon 020 str. F0370]|nr:hypothetical protein HMPREF9120_01963 [Neisseria sp. oral taxon 020 str. F0370]
MVVPLRWNVEGEAVAQFTLSAAGLKDKRPSEKTPCGRLAVCQAALKFVCGARKVCYIIRPNPQNGLFPR